MRFRPLLCLCAFVTFAAESYAADKTWPQWRGPRRDGTVISGTKWPDSLKSVKRLWRVELGPGYPGPILSQDKVFVAETKGRKLEVVRALDRKTGKEIWQTSWPGSMTVPFFAAANGSWIRSTPAYDGERLYVGGMRDVLVCIDAKTGKQLWKVDFVNDLKSPLPSFGFVCSPLVVHDAVYVQAGASFVKLDKRTGKIIWRSLNDGGGAYGSAFSSPVFAKMDGRPQLIVQTRKKLAGVDPKSGKDLWSQPIPAFRGMNILTPVLYGDFIFTSSYGGKSFLYNLKGNAPKEVWTNRSQAYMSTPVVVGDHVYMLLKNQRFTCLDLKTGKTRWISTERLGKYCSLVVQGEKILALDQRGILLLIKANPERFELLDQRQVTNDESTWAHLAVVGDELFVRELNAIAAYKWAASTK